MTFIRKNNNNIMIYLYLHKIYIYNLMILAEFYTYIEFFTK